MPLLHSGGGEHSDDGDGVDNDNCDDKLLFCVFQVLVASLNDGKRTKK